MAPVPRQTSYSLVGLNRWSCRNNDLPAVVDIKYLHVYDFDNTLFSSPLPSPQIWAGPTLGYLQTQNCFSSGGWWHDPGILSATGEGIEKEQARAWQGWWNEAVAHLAELSIKQKDALTVLLTGRGETNFADLVKRMVDSKELNFDLICLKPEVGPNGQRFATTIEFKNEFLRNLVFTYQNAGEIRIYEDRPKHVKHFREHFEKLNKSLLSHPIDQPPPLRKPITADVVQVAELNSSLDPVTEISAIQSIVNKHNTTVTKGLPNLAQSPHGRMKINSSYLYFGYLINPNDSTRLISLANIQPPSLTDSSDVRLMANSILIAPRPPDRQLLTKVGGKGKKLTWQVTGTAVFENKIWAARVSPVPEGERCCTNDPVPVVVLAPVPPEKAFVFETVVGDKQTLRIEAEDSGDEHYDSRSAYRGGGNSNHYHSRKRKFGRENGGHGGGARDNHDSFVSRPEDRDMMVRDRQDGTWVPPDRGLGQSSGRYEGRGGDNINYNHNHNHNNDGRRHFSNNNNNNNNSGRGGSGYQNARGGGGGGGPAGGNSGAARGGPTNNNNNNHGRRYDQASNNVQTGSGPGPGGGGGQQSSRGRASDRRDRGGGGGGGGGGINNGPGAGRGVAGRGRGGGGGGGGGGGNNNSNNRGGVSSYDGANEYRGGGGGGGGQGGNGSGGQMVMNY